MSHPNARRADLIIQQAAPDTVVYDQLSDRAHSLGPVASFVFRHADGSRSVPELAAQMSGELGVADDPALVSAALWELERAELLQDASGVEALPDGISRREAVRRFGTAALAVAAVTSIAAPTPALARSRGSIRPSRGSNGKGKGKGKEKGKGQGKSKGKGKGGRP